MDEKVKYNNDSLLTEKEVSEYLKVSLPTLREWRINKRNIPYFSISARAVRYRFEDVNNFLMSKKVKIS